MFEEQLELIEEMRNQTEVSKLKLKHTMQNYNLYTGGDYTTSYEKYRVEGGVTSPSSSFKIRFLCAILLGILAFNLKGTSYANDIEMVVGKIGKYKTIEEVTERVEVFVQSRNSSKTLKKE